MTEDDHSDKKIDIRLRQRRTSTATNNTPKRMKIMPSQILGPRVNFPLLYVSPAGTISVIFRNDVFVEMTYDRTIRVFCPDKFSAATNARGTASCVMHPNARIFQNGTHVFCELGMDKLVVVGSQGIVFTMKHLPDSFLVSSVTVNGTTPICSKLISYPSLRLDFSTKLLYGESFCGAVAVPFCYEIVRSAKYQYRNDGITSLTINGILMKQYPNGDVSIHNRPRAIFASPSNNTVHVRTHFVDMGVEEDNKAYVKRGVKRVHSSNSGVVVSDGCRITAMDHFGRIVSCT